MSESLPVYTIGHSTRPVHEFLELLRHYGIQRVVDVRTIPRSRHNPQFNKETLGPYLRIRGIKYLHVRGLGGLRRHTGNDSVNAGWRNASFRGFADYMQTPAFAGALSRLMLLAQHRVTAVMCSEAVPWRCHRSLIGDALVVRGVEVVDIMSKTTARPHVIAAMARVEGVLITYPAAETVEDGNGK